MSCDYDVRCLDCGVDAGFQDSNHADKEMRALAKMGPALKHLSMVYDEVLRILAEMPSLYLEPSVRFRDSWGWNLNTKWWREHGDHRLVSVDEYGRCDDECGEFFKCGECGTSKCCRRPKGHDAMLGTSPMHSETRDS